MKELKTKMNSHSSRKAIKKEIYFCPLSFIYLFSFFVNFPCCCCECEIRSRGMTWSWDGIQFVDTNDFRFFFSRPGNYITTKRLNAQSVSKQCTRKREAKKKIQIKINRGNLETFSFLLAFFFLRFARQTYRQLVSLTSARKLFAFIIRKNEECVKLIGIKQTSITY